jgi:hypothetical protein
MFCFYGNGNSPAHSEFRGDFTPSGLQNGNQIIKNYIGHVFMKDALITIRPQI